MIIKKITPQEACLYLGQEISIYGQVEILKSININGAMVTLFRGHLENYSILDENCKLLLRPLSDIAEEEAKELFFLLNPEQDPFEGWKYMEEIEAYNERYTSNLSHWVGAPLAWQYLLSKGFDLFGYIEQGKAIDKTKLPTT
jgi:hypothetical protein